MSAVPPIKRCHCRGTYRVDNGGLNIAGRGLQARIVALAKYEIRRQLVCIKVASWNGVSGIRIRRGGYPGCEVSNPIADCCFPELDPSRPECSRRFLSRRIKAPFDEIGAGLGQLVR